jgi:hypothetical protein
MFSRFCFTEKQSSDVTYFALKGEDTLMSDSTSHTFEQAAERTRRAADALAAKEAGKRRMATKDPGADTSKANLNRVTSGGAVGLRARRYDERSEQR